MGHNLSKSETSQNHKSSSSTMMKASSSSKGKHQTHDDGLSRATEITHESLSPPPSPAFPAARARQQQHAQSWRRGTANSSSLSRSSYPQIQHDHHQSHYDNHHQQQEQDGTTLHRRDSDPGYSTRKTLNQKSDPVKCPPRKTQSVCGIQDGDGYQQQPAIPSPDDENHGMDVSYLKLMYDSRTWEMYRRITEARRQSKYKTNKGTSSSSQTGTTDPTSSSLQRFQRMTSNGGRQQQQRYRYNGEDTSEWENLQYEVETSSGEEHHEMIFLFDF
jgi:hypothetical protein